MKPYKKVFKESGEALEVTSEREARQLVDISDLIWDNSSSLMSWNEAINSIPSGYELPTVQELYTAWEKEIQGFEGSDYWSSSTYAQDTNSAWYVNFARGRTNTSNKTNRLYVRYVKRINISYEDKIESLLVKHLKQNYNKSPKEIEAIEHFISSVLDDLEYTEFTMVEANKMLMLCKRFLGVI